MLNQSLEQQSRELIAKARSLIPHQYDRKDTYNHKLHATLMRARNNKKGFRQQWLTEKRVDGPLISMEFCIITTLQFEYNDLTRANKTNHKNGAAITPIERLEADAKNAIRWQTGTCGELSALVFCLLLEEIDFEKQNIRLEHITFYNERTNESHAFVIINRARTRLESDIYYPEGWGENSMIVDPYYNIVCFPNKLSEEEKEKLSWLDELTKTRFCKSMHADSYVGANHSTRWLSKRTAQFFQNAQPESSPTESSHKISCDY